MDRFFINVLTDKDYIFDFACEDGDCVGGCDSDCMGCEDGDCVGGCDSQ